MCLCITSSIKILCSIAEREIHWNHFETNLDMLGNQICRQLLGMQLKYHWWEQLALAMVTGNKLFL